ncbi:hypothetical protein FRC14_007500 [Serendipita sp. 396]|nr:hypothetical protein FRC14_007500 [Serendipita sp. 396]KAG8777041.1 hypothetical protein FRC15_011570 [Serendipita sp. 397]KAG8830712.1 hypothetical protein FRC20_008297 [Serendipita sp. 405]
MPHQPQSSQPTPVTENQNEENRQKRNKKRNRRRNKKPENAGGQSGGIQQGMRTYNGIGVSFAPPSQPVATSSSTQIPQSTPVVKAPRVGNKPKRTKSQNKPRSSYISKPPKSNSVNKAPKRQAQGAAKKGPPPYKPKAEESWYDDNFMSYIDDPTGRSWGRWPAGIDSDGPYDENGRSWYD